MGTDKKWYVIHTYSSYENKVKTTLELKVQSMGMEDVITTILVPTEDIVDKTAKGEEKIVKRKLYPGYVFVEMEVNDRSWYVVRNTPGVTGFVGSATKPIPLSDAEVKRMLKSQGSGTARAVTNIELGRIYRITEEGYRYGLEGVAVRVNAEKGEVTLSIDNATGKTEAEIDVKSVELVD